MQGSRMLGLCRGGTNKVELGSAVDCAWVVRDRILVDEAKPTLRNDVGWSLYIVLPHAESACVEDDEQRHRRGFWAHPASRSVRRIDRSVRSVGAFLVPT